MAYLTAAQIARIQARIASKEAAVIALEATLSDAMVAAQSYRLTSADSSTSTEYRSLHEIRNNIRILEREIDSLYRKLSGTGVVTQQLRRRI
jgi:predicted RNase H-like nuclease (RuvC/YqgF family)